MKSIVTNGGRVLIALLIAIILFAPFSSASRYERIQETLEGIEKRLAALESKPGGDASAAGLDGEAVAQLENSISQLDSRLNQIAEKLAQGQDQLEISADTPADLQSITEEMSRMRTEIKMIRSEIEVPSKAGGSDVAALRKEVRNLKAEFNKLDYSGENAGASTNNTAEISAQIEKLAFVMWEMIDLFGLPPGEEGSDPDQMRVSEKPE